MRITRRSSHTILYDYRQKSKGIEKINKRLPAIKNQRNLNPPLIKGKTGYLIPP